MSGIIKAGCYITGCGEIQSKGSFYCLAHRQNLIELGLLNEHGALADKKQDFDVNLKNEDTTRIISDHIKISIEQSAKGARVTATLDRSDHDIDEAVGQAVRTYRETIIHLKEMALKVDENGGEILY